MPRYHAHKAVGNEAAERIQVNIVELFARPADERQCVVRVGTGVAVAGKMLGRGNDVLRLQPAHIGRRFSRHIFFAFAKRAVANDGVLGIAVDV